MERKRTFGNGRNEFRVEVNCRNGSDCLALTKSITLMMNGCHCDATELIERALIEFEANHKDLFDEAINKYSSDSFSDKFWR